MHDRNHRYVTPGSTAPVSAGSFANRIFLPERVYEALPTAYISFGSLFVLGAFYIGIGHTAAIGYLAVGLSCVAGGMRVHGIRQRERSR